MHDLRINCEVQYMQNEKWHCTGSTQVQNRKQSFKGTRLNPERNWSRVHRDTLLQAVPGKMIDLRNELRAPLREFRAPLR